MYGLVIGNQYFKDWLACSILVTEGIRRYAAIPKAPRTGKEFFRLFSWLKKKRKIIVEITTIHSKQIFGKLEKKVFL